VKRLFSAVLRSFLEDAETARLMMNRSLRDSHTARTISTRTVTLDYLMSLSLIVQLNLLSVIGV
jgi:hypothetical protein